MKMSPFPNSSLPQDLRPGKPGTWILVCLPPLTCWASGEKGRNVLVRGKSHPVSQDGTLSWQLVGFNEEMSRAGSVQLLVGN